MSGKGIGCEATENLYKSEWRNYIIKAITGQNDDIYRQLKSNEVDGSINIDCDYLDIIFEKNGK